MTVNRPSILAVASLTMGLSTPGLAGEPAVPVTETASADRAGLDALLAIEGDIAWGEYLAGECTACHADSGGRIPPIAGLPREYMLSALHDYRTGSRENATMQNVVRSLGDEELAALAAYFESVE